MVYNVTLVMSGCTPIVLTLANRSFEHLKLMTFPLCVQCGMWKKIKNDINNIERDVLNGSGRFSIIGMHKQY